MNKGNTHDFTINFTSEIDERDYNGMFTCSKQSIMDQSKISRRKAELNGGMYCVRDDDGNPTGYGIDEEVELFNYAISVLETAIVRKPSWWDLSQISDEELVLSVFKEVIAFENSFRRQRRGKDSSGDDVGRSEESSSQEHQEASNRNQPKKVVDEQVQASLDA